MACLLHDHQTDGPTTIGATAHAHSAAMRPLIAECQRVVAAAAVTTAYALLIIVGLLLTK